MKDHERPVCFEDHRKKLRDSKLDYYWKTSELNYPTLEYFIISLGERRFLEDHWYISCLTIQVGILMVVYWKIMFYR